MSRSYWCAIFAVVGWLALQAASAKPVEKPTLESEPVAAPQHGDATNNHSGSNGKEGGSPDNLFSVLREIETAIHDLVAKPDPERDKRNEEREIADLQAQQDMALWAKAMAWATGLSLLISVIGLYLIWRSLKLAREAIHAEKRPWLSLKVEVASDFDRNDTDYYPEGFGVDIRLAVKNHGSSPALEVRTAIEEVLNTNESVLEDWDLDAYRDRLTGSFSKHGRRPRSTVFPSEKTEFGDRIVVSGKAIDRAIPYGKLSEAVPEFSLTARYIVAVLYRSPTSAKLHETSTVIHLFSMRDRYHMGQLVLRKAGHFKAIPKRRIRLVEFEQKRAN